MFGARHYWCATASLLAQLAFAATSHGGDSPTLVIVSSNTSDARLTRALTLIRGELSALGIDVQTRVADAPDAPLTASEQTNERLSLDVKEGVVVVRVFASGAQTPLVESVDLDGPDVTAEVIAVRAVEALRAARLLPSQAPKTAAPKAVAPKAPAERAPAEQPPAEQSSVEHAQAGPLGPVPILQLALGPTFLQNSQGLPQLSAQAAVRVGPSWGFVALGAEGSLAGPAFARPAGSAQVSRRTLFLQLGARVRLLRAWELSARGGLSYIHYAAKGVAQPGYLEQDLEHDTGAASLSLGGAYYFARAISVYLDFSSLVAFDAARLRLASENAVTLDRPSFALGVGLLLGAF
jgi:hypothetical protein